MLPFIQPHEIFHILHSLCFALPLFLSLVFSLHDVSFSYCSFSFFFFSSSSSFFPVSQLTVEAMKSDNEGVALQAVEFWSTICEEEVDISMEMADVSSLVPFLVERRF